MSRNLLATIGGVAVFLLVLILGFRELGSPKLQRLKQIDGRTVQIISQLAERTRLAYAAVKTLPPDFNKMQIPMKNPVNGEQILYRAKTGSEYELCSKFATDDTEDHGDDTFRFWRHPKGEHCFSFDAAAASVPNVPYNFFGPY
jgi:hypothetical protein